MVRLGDDLGRSLVVMTITGRPRAVNGSVNAERNNRPPRADNGRHLVKDVNKASLRNNSMCSTRSERTKNA